MIPKAFFSKGMGAFCRKSGGAKREMSFPISLSSRPSSFRAQREIFLAQRSNGERQLKSSRSTHAILSLPHKYRVPLQHKRSLGSARDDDTRVRFPHVSFHPTAKANLRPFGPPPSSGRRERCESPPFLQRGCKKAQPMRAALSDFKNYTLKRK